MAGEKILVTDLVQEVASKALALVSCEPLIQWVLEKMPIALEHDAAVILLGENSRGKYYLRSDPLLNESYLRDFMSKSLEAFHALTHTPLLQEDIEVINCNPAQTHGQELSATQGSLVSFYCSPLIVRENIQGVLAVSSRKPDAFPVYRLNIFNVFAHQIALAIDSLFAREQVVKQARIIERDSINMKTAFSGMSEGLIMTDELDQIILLNPRAKLMLGLTEETSVEEQNQRVGSLLFPVFKELNETSKQLVSKEIDLDKPKRIIVRIDATWAGDSKQKRIGTVIILRDITNEKEIDRLKTEFISTVSHELRTPLTTIRESVSQVLDEILGPTTLDQREFLSMCLEDIDRLTRMINDLLDISKIEARRVELRRETVDMVSLVNGVISLFTSRLKEKPVEIRSSFSQETIQAYIDKDKIIQVFTNLVGNSLKFTEQGHIKITLKDTAEGIECEVFDTGRGIAPEDLPKVFSKFQQFGRTDGPGEKGTGLGLSIAKGIIELHRGKIWIESKLGEWTKFSFLLPRVSLDTMAKEKEPGKDDKENISS